MEAAYRAMLSGKNQYAPAHGEPDLRLAVAEHAARFYGVYPDPEHEVTITNGAAEALHSIPDGLINPGDEVILFEPYYTYYPPNITMAGGRPRFVPLRPPDWSFDPDELAAAFNARTRAILINTPHNPTGKIFSRPELALISELCNRWNSLAISDEVYEHLVYDGQSHHRLADTPGMEDRTLTISSLSKTFNATGWRIGWVIAPADLTRALRLAHQYVIDCSATPLQYGAAAALRLEDGYFQELAADYQGKRDLLLDALEQAGFSGQTPASGYFILADISPLGFEDDFGFCRHLIEESGLAAIPTSAFYSPKNRHLGNKFARFAFCKTDQLLKQAAERLIKRQSAPD